VTGYGYYLLFKLSRQILRLRLKVKCKVDCKTERRRLFQMLGALYEKVLLWDRLVTRIVLQSQKRQLTGIS